MERGLGTVRREGVEGGRVWSGGREGICSGLGNNLQPIQSLFYEIVS